jgi:hypothetical protein
LCYARVVQPSSGRLATQVLDEDNAQHDDDSPPLADRERLNPLVGRDEPTQISGSKWLSGWATTGSTFPHPTWSAAI